MATNVIYEYGRRLAVPCTFPATPASGDPVIFGDLPGVAIGAEDTDGKTVVQFEGVADVSVKAIDGGGNSAVAAGDVIYYVNGDTPALSKKSTGVRYGVAMEAITSGSTDTINVRIG
ncbi:DUF2190 family protein [Actinotalea sp. M2MS4P-6]|uniref:DUF2190 family protein n=1 Tax=Actinotalea sp. M2MS4P-6 TaxID=2983762 RepID=UPI0021E41808|nr:DUF2190 family protein [Actinotalea sp. M2MS4P-6]MCV2395929.1 DUF2190 family protein [Actinotalea sp. M2MS4P-6]